MKKTDNLEKIPITENMVVYKTTCDCFCPTHSLELVIETEEGNKTVRNSTSLVYHVGNYPSTVWQRFTRAWKLLWTGKFEVDSEFIFRSDEQIQEFTDKLKDCRINLDK